MQLHDYQQDIVERVGEEFRRHRAVLVQLATAGGKTVLGANIAGGWNGQVRVLAHRNELVGQWKGTPGTGCPKHNVKALTVQTLLHPKFNSDNEYSFDDLLIVDEAHHYVDNHWFKAIEQWPGFVLGLTATPYRLNQYTGFDHIYGVMVQGPPKAELIERGFIVPALLKNPKFNVIEGRGKSKDGDFSATATMQLFARSVQQRAAMVDEPINWFMAEAPKGQAIGFCMSEKHLRAVEAYAESKGIATGVILGSTPKGEREVIFAEFKARKRQMLLTVNVLTEGVDLPICDTVVIMRPTMSLALYLQMVGRAVRVNGFEKQFGLVLDAAGNHTRFGHPDDDFLWSLKAKTHDSREPRICEWCDTVNTPDAKDCVNCGAPLVEPGDGMPRPKLICQKCGRSRSAKISACPYCGVSVRNSKVDLADEPVAFWHRNVDWLRRPTEDGTLIYEAVVRDAKSVAHIALMGETWVGSLTAENDEAIDDIALVAEIHDDGKVEMEAVGSKPYVVVDKVLNRARQIAREL